MEEVNAEIQNDKMNKSNVNTLYPAVDVFDMGLWTVKSVRIKSIIVIILNAL